MKQALLFISLVWLGLSAFAQTPQTFKYQTVARNNAGEILANQNITFQMTILQGELPGTMVYTEIHTATTNATGLTTLEIGRGTPATGNFAAINWSTTPIFLKIEIDPAGGSAFVEMGTSELLSVPFALFAENTANNDDADADPTNELQTFTRNGLEVSLSKGGGTINVADNDNNPANELQQISKAGNTVTLSQGGGSFTDANTTYTAGSGLQLTDTVFSNTDPDQTVTMQATGAATVSGTYPNFTVNANPADTSATNELQTFAQNGNEVTLSKGGGVISVADNDNDPVNELQTLTQTDNKVVLSQGGGSFMTGVQAYTQPEIDAMTPYNGLIVFNSTTNCINFYAANNWFESCGTCIPQPTQANAGADQYYTDATTSVILEANTPANGTGQWTIVSGVGGLFEDASIPTSGFTGQACEAYDLKWSVYTSCGSSTDNVNIGFNYQPTAPDAGPDQIGIGGNTTTLAGNTPGVGTGLWAVVTGEGGSFDDATSPKSAFKGVPTTDYVLSWTISMPCANLSDEVNIRFGSCGLPITDERDSRTYTTVQIGTQCWMAQNLNIGTRIYGSINQANNATIEKYCYSNYDAQCDVYGGLYQWNEMMNYTTTPGVQGICPTGWHLPTDAEWTALTTFLGGDSVAGGKLKETGTTHWSPPNTGATNSSGFTGLPNGYRSLDGSFYYIGDLVVYWSSVEYSTAVVWRRDLYYTYEVANRGKSEKGFGFSVRCLRD